MLNFSYQNIERLFFFCVLGGGVFLIFINSWSFLYQQDETGIYKNLLQEAAHRAGLNLPVYTTVRSGPGHVPIFSCTVKIAGMNFAGDPASTKKQAQKNAAIAAWSALRKCEPCAIFSAHVVYTFAPRSLHLNILCRSSWIFLYFNILFLLALFSICCF